MVAKTTAIPNGIHEGLTYEQYDAIEAVRRGLVLKGRSSMLHLHHAEVHGESETTAALLFGQALHAAVLEPDDFEERVILGPINPKTQEPYGRDSKACQTFADENPDKIVLGKGDRDAIEGMGKAIRSHPTARKLVRAVGRSELTLVWDDAATGVRCKARIDGFIGNGLGMIDLKSTNDASAGAFSRSVYDYGYHVQAAMTIDGWKALTGQDEPFTMIVCEKEPPYAVAVYTLGEDSLAVGRVEYREVLRSIVKCRVAKEWPGYPAEAVPLDVPEWVFKRFNMGE
jgi:hypothetical protein